MCMQSVRDALDEALLRVPPPHSEAGAHEDATATKPLPRREKRPRAELPIAARL